MFLSHTLNISWQIVNDILYIIDERDLSTYALDNVAKDFWLQIGRLHDFEEIKETLLKDYEGVDEGTLKKDLTGLMELLVQHDFVSVEDGENLISNHETRW